jgi:hypothetical protein
MANILASDLVKRKKEHVFVEGYNIDCATELTGSVDATADVMHVYGQDDAIKDITINSGTLSLTVYDKKTNNVLLDALQKVDPDDTALRAYNWNNIYNSSVWANRFNADNSQYTRSVFYGRWLPTPGMTAGDTNAKGTRTFAGNCDVPKEYTQPILGEKVKITTGATGTTGWTATLTNTPLQVNPGQTPALYAIRVVAVNEQRSGTTIKSIDQEDLTIDSTMVVANKTVTLDLADCASNSWITHVYVNYLYDKTLGVSPTIANIGMYKLVA